MVLLFYFFHPDDTSVIPGMGPEDKVDNTNDLADLSVSSSSAMDAIPGLDFDMDDKNCKMPLIKKVCLLFYLIFLHQGCMSH